jgi:Tol biopolymer transport system component
LENPSACGRNRVPAADGRAAFSASQTGVLIYRTGFGKGDDLRLTFVDRSGKVTGTFGAPGTYVGVDLSPDGKHAAVHRHEPNGGDIWIVDADRSTTSRLTFDAAQDSSSPIWSPDGHWIVFMSQRNGKSGLYSKLADGTGSEEMLRSQLSQRLRWPVP